MLSHRAPTAHDERLAAGHHARLASPEQERADDEELEASLRATWLPQMPIREANAFTLHGVQETVGCALEQRGFESGQQLAVHTTGLQR